MPKSSAARYVGRFAPSPTGALHLGSLTTALASYLHARQSRGDWLVRIENIDPPREVPEAADTILKTLEALELYWDGQPQLQLGSLDRFDGAVNALVARGLAFRCTCSRRDVRKVSGDRRYPGTCRRQPPGPGPANIRVIAPTSPVGFRDQLQGVVSVDIAATEGDYVIFRRDGLPAYHLAVVLDDAMAGVTDVVRGVDLLEHTPLHIHLQRLLELPTPRYWHLPVLTNPAGAKLSKQTGATSIDPGTPGLPARLLTYLGLRVPDELEEARPAEVWAWAMRHWNIDRHRGETAIQA